VSSLRATAREALRVNPGLVHRHAILGSNKMKYDWSFAGGEAELKKALRGLTVSAALAEDNFQVAAPVLGESDELPLDLSREVA